MDLGLDHIQGDFADMFQGIEAWADIVFRWVVGNVWFGFHNVRVVIVRTGVGTLARRHRLPTPGDSLRRRMA